MKRRRPHRAPSAKQRALGRGIVEIRLTSPTFQTSAEAGRAIARALDDYDRARGLPPAPARRMTVAEVFAEVMGSKLERGAAAARQAHTLTGSGSTPDPAPNRTE